MIVHGMAVAAQDGIEPGVLKVQGESMLAGCSGGTAVKLTEVQAEGKRRMRAAEFLRGYQVRSGERLGG